MASPNGSSTKIPESIIIVGLGVFGLSTALTISQRPQWSQTRITVIEASQTLPNPGGASTDHSRIVRPDYGNIAYAELAVEAQKLWRNTSNGWGADGRYHESGLALIANAGSGEYVQKSLDSIHKLQTKFPDMGRIEVLRHPAQVKKVTGGVLAGDWGYVNWGSGWADARASMKYALSLLDTGRVRLETGEVTKLIEGSQDRSSIVGVQLATGECLLADLIVLATGAWTNKLIDLRGQIEATGQPVAYLDLLDSEQELLKNNPIVMNMSTGLYVLPQDEKLLKIGRHSYGYSNPQRPSFKGGESAAVSLPPEDPVKLPEEAQEEFRAALRASFPGIEKREFSRRRVCWYTDTKQSSFLIDFHPSYSGLFLATGGSGHAFKFLPVIGEKIADALEGRLDMVLKELWRWPQGGDETSLRTGADASRGGRRGMVLETELKGQGFQR